MAKRKEPTVAPAPPAAPSVRRSAAIEAAKARVLSRTERASVKLASADGGIVGITAPHTDEVGQHYHLLDTFGTASADFMGATFSQLLESLSDASGTPNETTVNAALAIVGGLEPSNEIEALLAAQMAATHSLAMKLVGRTRRVDQLNQATVNGGLAVKLLRTFTLQAETLAKLRRGGGQTVRVEHVHVHPGGQAIVGSVSTGVGAPMKSEDQPHAKPAAALTHAHAPFDPLRSTHAEREPVPLARHA